MNQADVYKGLQEVFDSVFMSPVTVTPELSAHDVDEWDSIVHLSLVLAVEDKFNVRFRVGEVESTKNVGELADLIVKRAAR